MSSALIGLAAEIGAPLVRRILSDRIGPGNTRLAEQVAGAVAERVGVDPGMLEEFAADNPELVQGAIVSVEGIAPEMVQLAIAEAETREALLLAETAKGGWQAAWRPAGMYVIGFLWLWNAVLLHVLNAIFKIALPPMEWAVLIQGSVAYMGLYMGGHTVKDGLKTWRGKV
ncbi:hypothetical protein [Roseobacter sp. S98]|uniref:hypothetical protein n=1 Tax=Roseobacter algicola (ex Choi et al. 2025) (nom. illeg.) TaxID=3092138 RepID=UPI003F5136B9